MRQREDSPLSLVCTTPVRYVYYSIYDPRRSVETFLETQEFIEDNHFSQTAIDLIITLSDTVFGI